MKGRDAPSPASGVAAGSRQTPIQTEWGRGEVGEGGGSEGARGAESVLCALLLHHVELIKDLQFHPVRKVLQVSESRETSALLKELV